MATIEPAELEAFRGGVHSMEKALRLRRDLPHDKRLIDRLDRSRSWLLRSYRALSQEEELELGYICLWVAFNALYGIADEEDFERGMKRFLAAIVEADVKFPDKLVVALRHDALNALLTNPFLLKSNWTNGIYRPIHRVMSDRERFATDLKHTNYEEALHILLRRLYILRNQLFHGCSTHSRGTNRGSLIPAIRTLMRLLPYFWNVVESSEDTNRWGKLPFSRAPR